MAFQAPKGVSEYVPPRSALFERGPRGVRRVRPPRLLRRRRDRGLRGHRAVRPRRRRIQRRGAQGDVLLRRPRRPRDHAAPRVHRRRAARGARAQPAQGRAAREGVDQRPRLPVRAPAGRPVPAVLPVRPGGDRHRGPRGRRRDDRRRVGRLPVARPQAVHAAAELARRQDLPPRLPRGAAEVPPRAGPGRGDQAADRDQPAAGARRQAPRGPRAAGERARHDRLPVRRLQGPLRHGARACSTTSASRSPTRRGWSAASTTTRARRTNSTTRCSAPSRASAAAAGTTG